MKYQPIIGLEVHIELRTRSKMFCSCPNDPDERHPNVNICPVCMGHPGTLPVINEEAIRKVIKTGIALDCRIQEYSKFDRKNYFYPDLPKGYQISQYDMPLCQKGYLGIVLSEGDAGENELQKVRIRRIHLEEDTGRLVHPEGTDYSLVDFNRAGIPLMELVTEPDLRSAEEARLFAEELQLILRYLNVSDGDMEKGQMRVEANISLLPLESEDSGPKSAIASGLEIPADKLGTKVEIKNLNSFRAVERALNCEIKRQGRVLGAGKKIMHETRGWDDVRETTVVQRRKEEAHDYRYFPEPDLPPVHLTQKEIQEIKAQIPELPRERRRRFIQEYKLNAKNAEVFVVNQDLGEYFEKVVSELRLWMNSIEAGAKTPETEARKVIQLAANYVLTDLQGWLKKTSASSEDFLITPENFAEFVTLIYKDKISSKIAKMVLEEMFKTGADPSHIIDSRGLIQITDESEIEKAVEDVLSKNRRAIEDFKKGKENALQFLIGQVMAQTKGRAEPKMAADILRKKLSSQ